jgi:hypothetical protein
VDSVDCLPSIHFFPTPYCLFNVLLPCSTLISYGHVCYSLAMCFKEGGPHVSTRRFLRSQGFSASVLLIF